MIFFQIIWIGNIQSRKTFSLQTSNYILIFLDWNYYRRTLIATTSFIYSLHFNLLFDLIGICWWRGTAQYSLIITFSDSTALPSPSLRTSYGYLGSRLVCVGLSHQEARWVSGLWLCIGGTSDSLRSRALSFFRPAIIY